MEVREIKDNSGFLDDFIRLYESAFPENERIPFRHLLRRSAEEMAEFRGFFDKDEFIGFLYLVLDGNNAFLLFLAVHEDYRSRGYGSEMLRYCKSRHRDIPAVVAIEEVDDKYDNYDERVRRREFYRKNGFETTDYIYHEYRETYDLMTVNGYFKPQHFNKLIKRFSGFVLYLQMKPDVEKKQSVEDI